MQYGYFDRQEREYVITEPHTPVKWINYIGTRDFGGFVDHTGGALICKDDPTYNRITKYIQQMPSSDFKGETLYIRLHTRDGYRIFSPFYVPTLHQPDRFECRVGLGYTRILSEYLGLLVEGVIFVPLGEKREIRDIRITNNTEQPLDFDVIPVVEYTHPSALQQFTNADWVPQTMQSKAVADGDLTVLLQYPFMNRDRQVNFFTSNQPASSYETDRKVFLGRNEYGTFRLPHSLLKDALGSTQAMRGDNIAALLHPFAAVEPGETRRLITQLGQDISLEAAQGGIEGFRQPDVVDRAFKELGEFWDEYLDAFQVDTPDQDMNSMLNVHNPYQCYVTKTWSRYLSYYQLGLGSRGIGVRDSSQDILAVLAAIPEESKAFCKTLLSFQKRDGSAMHQFNPLTLEGSEGDSLEMEDRPHYYSDDHLWGVLVVTAYLKETGDFAFLDEIIPFYDKDKQGRLLESASVLAHLQRGIDFTAQDTGSHGLPLLGFADWNDTVNLPTGAESLFTAHLYGTALRELKDMYAYLGMEDELTAAQDTYNQMRARIEDVAWDGEWYVRYFDDEGSPLGSSKNTYGQIYLNAQSWAVISGFAPLERAMQAMDSVYRHLNTKFGIKLSSPGFDGYDPKYGGVTTYPPGAKENGGIFLHPNPWAIIAEAILGHGERAFEYYTQINPAAKNQHIDTYEAEPYVYAQNLLGDEHPQFGLGRNSWLSGTASWCYQAATQWILGMRPQYGGLLIDPCIPSAWEGYQVIRRFRGRRLHIRVHNPDGVCCNVVKTSLDGKEIPSNLVPAERLSRDEHHVEAWLGRA